MLLNYLIQVFKYGNFHEATSLVYAPLALRIFHPVYTHLPPPQTYIRTTTHMVVDYSKWDKLELSDDSDVEVHPNVDKNSFIRWKQRDIHEKREQQKFRVAQLEVNIETNEDLLRRVRKLITAGNEGHKVGVDVEGDVELAQKGETKTKPAKATSPEQPLYTDMLESMLLQIVGEDSSPAGVHKKLQEHEAMIENALSEERKELAKIEEERKHHITADDIRTGWDSTIVYKGDKAESAPAPAVQQPAASNSSSSSRSSAAGTGATTTAVETLNSPSTPTKPKVNEDGLEELLPATAKFGEISSDKLDEAFNYLMRHPFIVTEGQKDALLMSAFEHELAGHPDVARRVVWNSLLLQYCAVLGKDGVRLFFSKVVNADHPARQAFNQDVTQTYNHISSRCKILSAENEAADQAGGEETIQLHTVDPNTELIITVPEKDTDGWAIYEQFPANVRAAIESRSLDEINKVLAALSVEDAEDLVGKLSESGVLQVDTKIYEPQEWDEKKEQLTQQQQAPNPPTEPLAESSIDDVD